MPEKFLRLKELLAAEDYRFTPQREAIFQVIIDYPDSHLTAGEIHQKTKKIYPSIGIATVYRTLEIFETLKIVNRLQRNENGDLYEYNPGHQKHYHHHIICLGCGKIVEFGKGLLRIVEDTITRDTGFTVTDHSLTIYGYCNECLKSKNKTPKGLR